MSDSGKRPAGIGLTGVLFVVFLVLKLGVGDTSVEAWSWWWVTAPLWAPVLLGVLALLVIVPLTIIREGRKSPEQKAREALLKLREGLGNG